MLLRLECGAEAVEEILPHLERAYRSGEYPLAEFIRLIERIHGFLPESIADAEPFRTLYYIGFDDYLGEARLREMYGQFFRDRATIEQMMPMPLNPTKKSLFKRLFGRKK